jgi:hypothetical protein
VVFSPPAHISIKNFVGRPLPFRTSIISQNLVGLCSYRLLGLPDVKNTKMGHSYSPNGISHEKSDPFNSLNNKALRTKLILSSGLPGDPMLLELVSGKGRSL